LKTPAIDGPDKSLKWNDFFKPPPLLSTTPDNKGPIAVGQGRLGVGHAALALVSDGAEAQIWSGAGC
jgi:hypothetical protein